MKKFTFTFLIIASTLWSQAQIILVNSNLAPVGTTIVQANDTLPDATIVPGNAGANQTWNFSALTEDYYDTLYTELPSSTPYPDRFPNANFVIQTIDAGDTLYAFFIRNDDLFANIGLATTIEGVGAVALDVVPEEVIIDFPMQYEDHRDENFYYQQTVASPTSGIDSIRFKNSIVKTTDVDAWGDVTLPSGTYNSLRSKTIRVEKDSVWVLLFGTWNLLSSDTATTVTYDWYSNEVEPGFTLVSMDYMDSTVSNVSFLKGTPTGIKQTETLPLTLYPNPAQKTITVRLPNAIEGTAKLYSQAGGLVLQKTVHGQVVRLKIAPLSAGTYFVVVTGSSDGNLRYTGKIIKK